MYLGDKMEDIVWDMKTITSHTYKKGEEPIRQDGLFAFRHITFTLLIWSDYVYYHYFRRIEYAWNVLIYDESPAYYVRSIVVCIHTPCLLGEYALIWRVKSVGHKRYSDLASVGVT